MQDVLYTVTTRAGTADEIRKEIVSRFDEDGWFLLEQPHRCLTGKVGNLPDDWATRLISCTLFNADTEMRIEADSTGGQTFMVRLVHEGEGNKAWARRQTYLLRKHKITGDLYAAGYKYLVHTEYFEADPQNGIPVLVAERLSGFASAPCGGN